MNYEISLTLFPIKHIPGENVKSKIDGFIHWDARSLSPLKLYQGLSMLFVTEKISKKIFFSETLRTHPYTKYTMYYCLYSIQIDEKCAF